MDSQIKTKYGKCCKNAQFLVEAVAKTEKIWEKQENLLQNLRFFVIIIISDKLTKEPGPYDMVEGNYKF